ncbi:putative Dol-P-Glc:Glc(2)Man(9)GlcNAc(2)-PP-Dol alpha-1,2-glucosyltransferase [Hyposmocoma kahamanoa]|uniref:putative Dol-P-Glc:Glc(2)Man(9)GlcNAc(2)-PP-Dol alpha-1,2-glucosyltransferase n=1 Tax=Hyposmocoma kahamanoa TaxID=1477025 RepID=UPI000E6D8E5E|nr:putative Dol-P-Glc:Glc(2)Man(9)GlcNAc(2)-PP-Dol alpha-1,2-glucosyltransferase [Hyposmocoma kahamanoa]
MNSSTKYYVYLGLTIAAYFVASKFVFDKVYDTIRIVIDELFHIPQGLAFCKHNFTYWDPKITTLPGLYLVSSVFLGNYFKCNTYNLRFTNLIASVVNLILFASIFKFTYGNNQPSKNVLQALSLAILPPLYFFSHVYYTDTLSLTFLLIFSRLCFTSKFKISILIFGLWSVLMRQTNIVWVAMVFGHKTLDMLIRTSRVFGNTYLTKMTSRRTSIIDKDIDNTKLKRYYGLADVYVALKYHLSTCFVTFFKYLTIQDWLVLLTHGIILITFVTFVFLNGSIVLGDKKAHEATIHIPQMFYFLIFYGIFGLPYVIIKFTTTFKLIFGNKLKIIILTLIFLAIVHFNTVSHPYLLADNRHYTFYVWNRWYGKYYFAKYVSVPVYVFLLINLYANLKDQNCVSFLLPYTICVFIVLSLQKMIEIRYFLIPYIILRLRFAKPSVWVVFGEFLWYIILNAATFYLFFTKEIIWKDFDYTQRLIW